MPASSAPKNLTNAILFICVCLNMVRSGPASVADEAADDYKPRINRMLFLGNSITLHGPAPQIGWTGNWGLAASAIEKDYVHLLLKRVTAATAATVKSLASGCFAFAQSVLTLPAVSEPSSVVRSIMLIAR